MDKNCIFCKIIAGQAPAKILYQDEQVTAFRDLHPAASTHILIVPNKHIASVNEATSEDEPALGHLFTIARQLAEQEGVAEPGYRLLVNTGPQAGQVVYHLHLHLLGGKRIRHFFG
jgi:histidine triad (HIT) family protein